MSLAYILGQVSPAIGLDLDNVNERAWIIQQINKAAKELYEGRDLANVDREQAYALEGDDQQISLPYYVGQVRAVRRYWGRDRLDVTDMRPRYKSSGWTEGLLTWREKWKSPLKRHITNEAPMTLTIPQAELLAFTVVVTGSTPDSARITEEIVFAPGDVSKITVNQWTEIVGFTNLGAHTYDVTLLDVDGVELSVLPNVADRAQYIVLQVLDSAAISVEQPYLVEVLYKNAFLFLRNDYDEFVCPGYDDAIAWQAIGNTLAKHRPAEAGLAFAKVKEVLASKDRDQMQSKDKSISFESEGTSYPFGMPHSHGSRAGLFPGGY